MTVALRKKKYEALKMREQGASYSQIKGKLQVSKSSLSLWLHHLPLSQKRIRELRDHSAIRIERYRETRRRTRDARWALVKERAAKEIGDISKRELLIGGLFLYWGEGGKTKPYTTTMSNTDPAVIRFFINWLELLGASKSKFRVYVHLYADMNAKTELHYWSKVLGLPLSHFRKPYIKSSNRTGLTYAQKFTHGTCNLIYDNRDISEYVLSSLEHLRSQFAPKQTV